MNMNGLNSFEFDDQDMSKEPVVINDCVHGHIKLSRDLMRVVDTQQFQRLRDLKQLGLGSYVYPGATHTRFAHSIGVCHLAGTFVRELKKRQDLGITDREIFCVEVAGLCHDLGHGPFSHMFEKAVKGMKHDAYRKNWTHEDASLALFDMMVVQNDFKNTENGLFRDEETEFIKALIHPKRSKTQIKKGKEFLYEIVANERTGLDVDRFDYFARDCHALGISNMFDHNRFIMMARVLDFDNGERHICHRDKELENVIIMFQTRFSLHMHAYQHPVVCALDRMVCDAFHHADKFLKVQGKDRPYALTESVKDMEAYIRLSDSVLHTIRDYHLNQGDNCVAVEAAQTLIKRMEQRKLYKLVHTVKNFTAMKDPEVIEREILDIGKGKFDQEDIYVQVAKFDFGAKKKNPLEMLYLYSKLQPKEPICFNENMVSNLLLPKTFSEERVRVYCKSMNEQKLSDIRKAAKKWETDSSSNQENQLREEVKRKQEKRKRGAEAARLDMPQGQTLE